MGKTKNKQAFLLLLSSAAWLYSSFAQVAMVNITGRERNVLNGSWQVMVDPYDAGDWRKVWLEKEPLTGSDFNEYSFEEGPLLHVPGDFNSQLCELYLYEGIVWYKKQFRQLKKSGKRYFLYFGAVNYKAEVYLNKVKIGSHEGGFTPFQFEVTGLLLDTINTVIVKADNRRLKSGLPGLGFDWFNYGGITREVSLVETDESFIKDYFIQLSKGSMNSVEGWIKVDGAKEETSIKLSIPEINFSSEFKTNKEGYAEVVFNANFKHWSPNRPKRYEVILQKGEEELTDTIGFRCIEVKGSEVFLNGKKIFLKSVNIHEENPVTKSRCTNENDARLLLYSAKQLGCNMVRLVHYPHNEHMIRVAEQMGIMVWSELPVYQHINFSDSTVKGKIETMQHEMITRDKNSCAVIVWGLSNETYPGTANRNATLIAITEACKKLDTTRLIVHVANTQRYSDNEFTVWDPIYHYSDLVAVNEYIGWYEPWQGTPEMMKWESDFLAKPVFISEFGGEAVAGYKVDKRNVLLPWMEDYQDRIYENQIRMFRNIPGLCGISPWLLFDYRSPVRMNQVYQKGYNMKGLISVTGQKKMAWYQVYNYFKLH